MASLFAFGSLMSSVSLSTTLHGAPRAPRTAPCILRGFRRTWTSIHTNTRSPNKRYIHLPSFDDAPAYAFSNIVEASNSARLAGVCIEVDSSHLAALDRRESGYVRQDVSSSVERFLTSGAPISPPVFTYIDTDAHADLEPVIGRGYLNLLIQSARDIDSIAPGFWNAFITSTDFPTFPVEDVFQLFIDSTGRNLFLLESVDSSVVLLHTFNQPQFQPRPEWSTTSSFDLSRPITGSRSFMDVRKRDPASSAGAREQCRALVDAGEGACYVASLLERISTQKLEPSTIGELCNNPFWLVRAAVADLPYIPTKLRTRLANDGDPWVRRAANVRRNN